MLSSAIVVFRCSGAFCRVGADCDQREATELIDRDRAVNWPSLRGLSQCLGSLLRAGHDLYHCTQFLRMRVQFQNKAVK